MGNAKPKSSLEQDKGDGALGELEQLRAIIFGQAQQELTQRISSLEDSFNSQINVLTTTIENHFAHFTQNIDALRTDINQQLAQQDSNHVELSKVTESLASSLEMAEATAKSDTDGLEAHIVKELERLDAQIAARFTLLEERFSSVSSELSSSKTDRKTLADLLAGMATQLATDKP